MKTIICTLFCISTLLHAASSLTCYQCESTISYADCEKRQEQIACESGQDMCIKGDISYRAQLLSRFDAKARLPFKMADWELQNGQDQTSFKKYCATSSKCDKKQNAQCKTAALGENIECNIHCCALNLCNAGSNVIVSGVLMVSAVIIRILF